MNISVIVPVFNSAATLEELVRRTAAVLQETADRYEIILVNDGSSDGSWETILKQTDLYPEVVGIDLMRNYGQHNALLQGIKAAREEIIVTLDDDLQNPPEEIPRLLKEIEKGADVVYGTPATPEQSFWRRAGSNLVRIFLRKALNSDIARIAGSFRAFRTSLREAFSDYRGPFIIIDVPLSWATSRFHSVTVRHDPRPEGRSTYSFIRLLGSAINVVTGFSVLPLQAVSLLGFFFTIFGGGVLAYTVGRYLILGYSFPGFPFLASIIAIFSGAQFLVLGVMGSYLARLHFRSMGRPAGLVREVRSGNRG